jgi:hypothetical protein
MLRFVLLVTSSLIAGTWAAAETVDVKYYGLLDLKTLACTEITRSTLVNRVCYDKAQQFMVVQLNVTYYPYCEMPAAIFEAFLAAPSMGKYYNASIKGTGKVGPFDCRTHRKPAY